MEPDRIDFSSLDPSRDGARWEAMVQRVSAHAVVGHRSPVLWQLTAWARPALAIAALAAFACWLPALLGQKTLDETAQASQLDGPRALSEWEANRPAAPTREVLSSLGVSLE